MTVTDDETKLTIHVNSALAMLSTINAFIKTIKENKVSSKEVNQSIFELTILGESLYEALISFSYIHLRTDNRDSHAIFKELLDKNEIEINSQMRKIVELIRSSR